MTLTSPVAADSTLVVTTGIASSMQLVIDDAPGAGAAGTDMETDFSSVSRYGVNDSGATRSMDAGDPNHWMLSGPVAVRVLKANLASSNCTITAKVAATQSGLSWTLNDVALTTSFQTVRTNTAYETQFQMALELTISDSRAPGAFENTITLVATSN